ncbi:ribosomal protein S3Ae [Tritrichomonas foetus]|uniref:Ribosomal protein S3Ae n=1 Tax=Tritrichomonas foetus TaxID=1144522 RepID=A0A1J4KYE9_9EUKA|nr:ribosomal protein S3Ae [Tritrichomonas foetus]OHT16283.1 ribosomal protein S3Ae [Tritrichomonas foetus]|eukprot:OHT16283.1 ribosomal protein S3Ae [Tritrichomonas foetus]
MGKAQQRGKASKKIKQDTFLKKEWRHVFVPGFFGKRNIGYTVSHKCARGKTPADYLNNRVFELSHGDLVEEQSHAYRLFSWKSVAVNNDDVLTVFAGMRLSTDKLCSLLRKYRTLIDASVDARTPDGYILRSFCMGFTRRINPNKKACYAQQSKRRAIREVMISAMRENIEKCTIQELCTSAIAETVEKAVVERCATIMQIDNVFVTKIKVIKAPTFSDEQLKKLHQGRAVQKTQEVARPPEEEAAPAPAE